LEALRAVRASQQEAQQREWSACLQVKQAVEMAEEANFNKARVRETNTHNFPDVLTQNAFLICAGCSSVLKESS